MSALLELAERCEQATGPDRELDCAIYNASPDGPNRKAERLPMEKWGDRCDDGWRTMWADRDDKYPEQLKRYTASLDAAMTLAPRGRAQLVLERAIEACLLATSHRSDDFVKRLPAFVTAAALRTLAPHHPGSTIMTEEIK